MYAFRRLTEIRKITDNWIREYNKKRPHNSLGDLVPREFLMANSNWKNSKISETNLGGYTMSPRINWTASWSKSIIDPEKLLDLEHLMKYSSKRKLY
jgi:hypothetical protein